MALADNPIIYLSQKLWTFSKGNRRNVVLFLFLFLIANIIGTIEPFVIAKILDVIQLQGITHENIRFIILLASGFVGLQIVFWSFWGPARVIENTNAFLAKANYKTFLLNGVLDLPASWHADHHSGDTIDKIEKGTKGLSNFGEQTFQITQNIFRLLSSFFILSYFNITSGIIVFVMVIVTILMILKIDKKLIEQYQQINRIENSVAAKIFDVISNVTTVIILRVERLVSRAIVKKILQPFRLFIRNNIINEFKWGAVSICGSIMIFLVLSSYFLQSLAMGSAIAIGTVYLLWSYVSRVTDVFFNFAYLYGEIVQNKTGVLNAEILAQDFLDKKNIPTISTKTPWKKLAIENLSFSYHAEDGANLHLDDVSMTITHGERIALIGESGSGKTTLLKILRGLYTPKHATISLDGKRLTHGLDMMSSHIALIPQDPEIFATTIRENITMGVDHTLSTIKKFTTMARFTDVAERLPKQWDSSIVEKGVNLSGGEKQRLALARGLMACTDKSIILLDEPTSSIDMKNETLIYENIFKTFNNKTVISSIHRLHLLHLFDTIYYFDSGKIIASGSFSELLTSSPKFQALWQKYQEAQNAQE